MHTSGRFQTPAFIGTLLTKAQAQETLKRPRIGRCRCMTKYVWEDSCGIVLYGTRTPCCNDVFYKCQWAGHEAILLKSPKDKPYG